MQLSEKEVENFIYNDLVLNNGDELESRGMILQFRKTKYPVKIHWFQQLAIPPYGIIDLVGFYRYKGGIHVELLELKSIAIQSADFDQVFRYKRGLEIYLRNTFDNCRPDIQCHLIGNGYESGEYIQNNCDCIVSEFSYDLSGVIFKSHQYAAWYITDSLTETRSFRDRQPARPLVRLKFRNGSV